LKYRSRTDIIAQMLRDATNGATKTRLMYSAYVSYDQIQKYLALLQKNGLLTYVHGVQLYKLKEKGLHFLNGNGHAIGAVAVGKGPKAVQPDQSAQELQQNP
jgi:predicted transcriptional regulator